MKNCIIVGAGDFDIKKFRLTKKDFVIAADKGLASLLQNGEKADLFVGDCDSLGYIPENIEKIILPREKDDTDLMFALKEGIKRGFDSFKFFGCLGGKRFSHSISSVMTLIYAAHHGKNAEIIDTACNISVLRDGENSFSGKGFFSLFSFEGATVDICGAKFDGKDISLTPDFPIGQSNEFLSDTVKITLNSGSAFIITEF